MATIGVRGGRYYIDFRYKGLRYREQTNIVDNLANRKQVSELIKKVEAEITLDSFDYLAYFPNGKGMDKFKIQQKLLKKGSASPQFFENFAEVWFNEKRVEWSRSYRKNVRSRLDNHIIRYFKGRPLAAIDKASIMAFRSNLAELPGMSGGKVTASFINNTMLPLRQILREGAERFNYPNPWKNIKHVREQRKQVMPFSIHEMQLFLSKIRPDFKAYYTTRFFSGLRTGEIDGLLWKYIDFDRRQILVREALVQGRMVGTKTDG
jgi:integrase